MIIEVCDLCNNRVHELNKTEVIIKDYKGLTFDFNMAFPARRRFKGLICDECLNLLRHKKENKNA